MNFNIYILNLINANELPIYDYIIPAIVTLVIAAIVASFGGVFVAKRFCGKQSTKECIGVILKFAAIEVFAVASALLIHGMTGYVIRLALYMVILLCISYQDIKTYESEHYFHVIALVSALIGIDGDYKAFLFRLAGGAIMGLVLCIFILISPKFRGFGGGDYKAMLISALVLGLPKALIGSLVGLAIGLVVNMVIVKTKKLDKKEYFYPQLPYLAVGLALAGIQNFI